LPGIAVQLAWPAVEVSLAAMVVAAPTDVVFAATTECVVVEVFAVAAEHPVSADMPATLNVRATLRARRAGWGRLRRDAGVVIVPPSWVPRTSLDAAAQRHLGFDEEPDKKSPT